MKLRKADLTDIDQLLRIRKIQLRDEGQRPDTDMDGELRRFFQDKMGNAELVEWVAEDEEGRIIATAAIQFMDFPPAFTNPTGRKGYITNMYTSDEYRGRGLAGQLMQKLENEARDRGVTTLLLHASEMGRKAYIKNGYKETDILMEKTLPAGMAQY